MTWYNSNMSILLGMTNSCSKDNAKFAYNIPKNPYEQLGWQLRIMLSKLQILSCPHLHKRGQLWIFNIDCDFEDVQSNWFTSVRLHNPVITELHMIQNKQKLTKEYFDSIIPLDTWLQSVVYCRVVYPRIRRHHLLLHQHLRQLQSQRHYSADAV